MARTILGAVLLLAAGGVEAAGLVSIETIDGRELRGVVDARTDDGTLWLRSEENNVFLSVPIGWDAVASARVDDAAIDVIDLRSRRGEMVSEGPQGLIPEVEMLAGGAKPQAAGWAGIRRRVRNVDIVGAGLVNLDRDVEPDGFQVSIVALGDDGAPMAVRGNLSAVLHGQRRPLLSPEVDFGEIGRWNQRVRAEDFVDGAATYCLPFRNTAPEWEFDLMPDAVLTVQLGASGYGNFSATTPVVLREFNPLRDDLQLDRGTRFLPNEVQGWRSQVPFGVEQGRWQWWGR